MKSDALLKKISWASYDKWEGPFFRGQVSYQPTGELPFWVKVLRVITATEGAHFDAINMYDRCVVSVGLVQLCDVASLFLSTQLLGRFSEVDGPLLQSWLDELPIKATVIKVGSSYRLKMVGDHVVADKQDQEKLYLGGSTGLKGQWTPGEKDHAKRVAAVLAGILGEPKFQEAQMLHILPRLPRWLMPESNKALFSGEASKAPVTYFPVDGWEGAMRAILMSFTANLPAVADKQRALVMAKPEWKNWNSRSRCVELAEQLTFGPKIAIYPQRYNAIRPVVEKLFGVDLPDFAEQLKTFVPEVPLPPVPVVEEHGETDPFQPAPVFPMPPAQVVPDITTDDSDKPVVPRLNAVPDTLQVPTPAAKRVDPMLIGVVVAVAAALGWLVKMLF